MPCYHPLIRLEDTTKWVKAEDGHRYHPAKVVSQECYGDLENLKDSFYHKQQIIPCGKCIGCRLDYSREWANRGYLEAKGWEQNWFCTITYDEEHIPIPEEVESSDGFTYTNDGSWTGTLVPKDLQQFIKNVRQIMKRERGEENIRFMACGEYGSESMRPHYHIIFFNLNLPLEDLYSPRIINKEIYYQSKIIERAWGGIRYLDEKQTIVNPNSKGISNISEATWNNIAYTARYITKKINGKESEELYAEAGKVKEFLRVSRMPGIGEKYYREHWQEIYERDEIIIKNKAGTISSKPPKYFDELYKKDHPKEFKKLQEKRIKEAKQGNKLKDQQTSIFRQQQNELMERSKEEQHQKLVRLMESSL